MELINTLEAPGEFDALATLRPGEPYFLLVGRDRLAPPLISEWADRHRRKTLAEFDAGTITKPTRDEELRKATQAEDIASSMVDYKNNWVSEKRAAPEDKPTYSGHQLPEETRRRDALQAARARAVSAMHNAAAAVVDLQALMGDERALYCDMILNALNDAADKLTPPRPVIDQIGGLND